MHNIKTLIFDFDGTLADTLAFTVNSALEINRKLNLLNDEKIDVEKFRSMDSFEFIRQLEIPKLKLLYFLFKYQRKLVKNIVNINTFEGLPEMLGELKKKGVNLGVVTSNSRKNVKKFLKNNDIECFDFVYSSLDYFNKSKMLEKAVKKFHMNKDSVVYVGDEVRDIKAAKEAGIKVASVTWGYNFENILSSHNPDFIVYRPKDLLNLIK